MAQTCIYIHIYTCVYIHVYVFSNVYIHIYICIYIRECDKSKHYRNDPRIPPARVGESRGRASRGKRVYKDLRLGRPPMDGLPAVTPRIYIYIYAEALIFGPHSSNHNERIVIHAPEAAVNVYNVLARAPATALVNVMPLFGDSQ